MQNPVLELSRAADSPEKAPDEGEDRKCRICLETDGGILIHPCNCQAGVHPKCLAKWLDVRSPHGHPGPARCEVSTHCFTVTKFPRTPQANFPTERYHEVCKTEYNIQSRSAIVWRHICTRLSIATLFHLGVVLMVASTGSVTHGLVSACTLLSA